MALVSRGLQCLSGRNNCQGSERNRSSLFSNLAMNAARFEHSMPTLPVSTSLSLDVFFVLMGEFGISPTYFLTTSLDFRSSNPMARSFRRRRTERWQSVGCLAAPLITLQMLHLLCLFIPTLQPFDLFGSNYALIQNWFRVPKELG